MIKPGTYLGRELVFQGALAKQHPRSNHADRLESYRIGLIAREERKTVDFDMGLKPSLLPDD